MFSDAEALLFPSAGRPLIAVKSIHVSTNEMEEILQLLTARDIEHTNNAAPPSYAIFSIPQTQTLRSNSVNMSPSVHRSQSISSSSHFHESLLYIPKSSSTYLLTTAELHAFKGWWGQRA